MSNFRTIDRPTRFLLPPSVDEWLPEKHLARFVVDVIEGLDLRVMSGGCRGSGSASYHPRMLLGILVYGYATGVFSSRRLERATYDSVAFRFIAANDHPDHDTIAAFRRRFLKEGLFVQVLLLAREMGFYNRIGRMQWRPDSMHDAQVVAASNLRLRQKSKTPRHKDVGYYSKSEGRPPTN
jgi:transposase